MDMQRETIDDERLGDYVYVMTEHDNSYSCRIFLRSIAITCAINPYLLKTRQDAVDWAEKTIAHIRRMEEVR